MVLYNCQNCNFSSNIKTHYFRHLNTQKHIKNIGIGTNNSHSNSDDPQMIQNDPQMIQNDPQMIQNDPQMIQNDPQMIQNDPINLDHLESLETNLNCQYCNKSFTLETNRIRHELHRCKENPNIIIKNGTRINLNDKKKLVSIIENLFDKYAGDTINNNNNMNNTNSYNNIDNSTNNTIILNNYGQEDISHITDKMKMNYLKLPYDSIQKMIEQVHFNNNKPENKNIAITNKKEKDMIKIYKDNKWRYGDRKEIIDQLIQINYGRIDDHYEREVKGTLSNVHNNRYMKFQHQFDNQHNKLIDMIKKDVEMIILSENLS